MTDGNLRPALAGREALEESIPIVSSIAIEQARDKRDFDPTRPAGPFFPGDDILEAKFAKAGNKALAAGPALAVYVTLAQGDGAMAASKSQRCDAYARNAARSAPTRGGQCAAPLSELASAPSQRARAQARPLGPELARRDAWRKGAAPTAITMTGACGADRNSGHRTEAATRARLASARPLAGGPVQFGHELVRVVRLLVAARLLPLRQDRLIVRQILIGDLRQEIASI